MKPPEVKYIKVTPQFHAERCPVCAGWGEVGKIGFRKPCHGCGGKGYVEVPNFDVAPKEENAQPPT